MNWKFWEKRAETRAASTYGDAVVNAILSAAQSHLTAAATQTAAVEFGAGMVERSFAVAGVSPDYLARTALTPLTLATLGRRLMLTGNAVFAIDTSGGQLELMPAANYHISGEPRESSWRYLVHLDGPSGTVQKRLPSRAVVHVRIGASVERPWDGVSPITNAGVSASLLGRIEQRLAEEANTRNGYLLVLPDGVGDDTVDGLKTDVGRMQGGIYAIETTSMGHGQGNRAAPQVDLDLKRLGATFPESNIALRRDVGENILAAMGIPSSLFSGTDGATVREGFRMVLVQCLQPLAALITAELSKKLEMPVDLDFKALHAADIQARARAFAGMVASGLDKEEALEISGLTA